MKYKIEFGFGAEWDRNKQRIDYKVRLQAVKNIEETATQLFGGCTILETWGSWKAPDGHIYKERGGMIIAYADSDLHVKEMVQTIKDELSQEAVAVNMTELFFSEII